MLKIHLDITKNFAQKPEEFPCPKFLGGMDLHQAKRDRGEAEALNKKKQKSESSGTEITNVDLGAT